MGEDGVGREGDVVTTKENKVDLPATTASSMFFRQQKHQYEIQPHNSRRRRRRMIDERKATSQNCQDHEPLLHHTEGDNVDGANIIENSFVDGQAEHATEKEKAAEKKAEEEEK